MKASTKSELLIILMPNLSTTQSAGQLPEPIVAINVSWDIKQTFSKAYGYCIKHHED